MRLDHVPDMLRDSMREGPTDLEMFHFEVLEAQFALEVADD